MDLERINLALRDYDSTYFENLDLVLRNISHKSKALASNLKDCIIRLKNSDRYLRAYRQEKIAVKDSELEDEEFEIFRKYVRLLRSCTIMCGHESSNEYKKLFIDFFSGTRLKLAQELRHKDGTC